MSELTIWHIMLMIVLIFAWVIVYQESKKMAEISEHVNELSRQHGYSDNHANTNFEGIYKRLNKLENEIEDSNKRIDQLDSTKKDKKPMTDKDLGFEMKDD